MSEYYGEDNALYRYIENNAANSFAFYKNTISLMLAVTTDYSTQFILIDDRGVDVPDEYRRKCAQVVVDMVKKLHVPAIWVIYKPGQKLNNDSAVDMKICTCNVENNKASWTIHSNIPIRMIAEHANNSSTAQTSILTTAKSVNKALNSKPSSEFHEWQRDYWETKGFIIDIDLVRIDNEKHVSHIYELKRSGADFETWMPYAKDRNNYLAQAKTCDLLKVRFNVLFNHKVEKDGKIIRDDISKIKIFDVYHKIGLPYEDDTLLIKFIGIESKEDFINPTKTLTAGRGHIFPDERSL